MLPPSGRRPGHLPLLASLLAVAALAGARDVVHAHPELEVLERAANRQLARHPDDPELSLQQAQIYRVPQRWDAALTALDHAAAHGADRDVVGAIRGQVLLDAGRPGAAKLELDGVLVRRPDAFAVLFDRGRASLALGRPEDAARDFAGALAGLPQPRPEQVFARRDVLVALGRREDALRALDDGLAKLGPAASLHLAALALEVELERYDQALRRLDELIALEPRNEAWVVRRGEILEKAGRPEEARAAYAHALALIGERPPQQRGRRLVALENRLKIELAAAASEHEGER